MYQHINRDDKGTSDRHCTWVDGELVGLVREYDCDGRVCFEAGAYTRSLQNSTCGPSGHIAHVRAQRERLWATSTGSFGLCRGQSKLKLSGKGQRPLNLSGNGNEFKPLLRGPVQRRRRRRAARPGLAGTPRRRQPQRRLGGGQGLTLVPISAQLELTLPSTAQLKFIFSPYDPNESVYVSQRC